MKRKKIKLKTEEAPPVSRPTAPEIEEESLEEIYSDESEESAPEEELAIPSEMIRWLTAEPPQHVRDGEIWVQYVPLDVLARWPRNPKKHNIEGIMGSMERFGFTDPIMIDEATGYMVAGHGRLESLEQRKQRKEDPPKRIRRTDDGNWYVPVLRGISFDSAMDAEAYVIADNQLTITGGWDDELLLDSLQRLDKLDDINIQITGFDEESLKRLEESVGVAESGRQAQNERDKNKGRLPGKRTLPVDAIFTVKGGGSYCCMAVKAGLAYGTQSSTSWICPNIRERGHDVRFIDNEWHGYDHEQHRRLVGRYHPKYATTRDIMTRHQCDEAGVEYYSEEQIMVWAEDMEQFCENVIVIPKYDCIDRIPEKYVLGYSVPSSYGGTPLPLEAFRGRRVHLLGGSWKSQLEALAVLGEDCVSLDFNMIYKVAMHGGFVTPDGKAMNLANFVPFEVTNPVYVCCCLSFGAIASWIKRIDGLDSATLANLKEDEVGEYIEEVLKQDWNQD